jgi:hypothetical protein
MGSLLGSTGRTAVALGPVISNTAGTVAFGGYTSGAQAGVNANGELARITLHVNAAGSFGLELENGLLADRSGSVVRPSGVRPFKLYLPLVLK